LETTRWWMIFSRTLKQEDLRDERVSISLFHTFFHMKNTHRSIQSPEGGAGAVDDKKDEILDPIVEVAPRRQRRAWDDVDKEKEKESESGSSLAAPLRGSGIRRRGNEGVEGVEGVEASGEGGVDDGEGGGRALGADAAERRAARRRALGIE
jgi:hypothetical protein